ncbi:hypothetical protein V7021_04625 [Cytobacillus firmus]
MNQWAWLQKKKKQTKNAHQQVKIHGTDVFFSSSLDSNLEQIQNILGNNPDIAIRTYIRLKQLSFLLKGLPIKSKFMNKY